jgi:hypothetical protein
MVRTSMLVKIASKMLTSIKLMRAALVVRNTLTVAQLHY